MSSFHIPVLLKESINGLHINPDGIYVDVTFGGGGHSRRIIDRITNGKLIAFDQDQAAIKNKIDGDKRFVMINKNFRQLKKQLMLLNIKHIDGLIADLGVSAYQFTDNNRGFSLKYNATIDMRMDKQLDKDGVFILNNYSRKNLNRIFKNHSDFKNPNTIVSRIINYRKTKLIQTTFDFKNILCKEMPNQHENKFFARLFQAIRIEVNDEINALKELLEQALEVLKPSGRLVVISYHSIEDKIVKNFMRFGNFINKPNSDLFGNHLGPFNVITKKPIVPTIKEIKSNNKSRSAKLRICEKI